VENVSFGSIMGLVRGKTDLFGFAQKHFSHEIYTAVYDGYFQRLSPESSLDDIIGVCCELYESMFRLNLRLNNFVEVYDEESIYYIAIQAIERLGAEGFVRGMNKRSLASLIYRDVSSHTPETGRFALDCHVHTSDASPCAIHSADMMIRRAIGCGLDGICITDHNRCLPQPRIDALNRAYAPFRVFGGIEIQIEGDHFLVLGVHDDLLEQKAWQYPELHSFVREKGGFLALAHPLRYWGGTNANLYTYRPDAIEFYSVNMKKYNRETKQELVRLANALGGLKPLANSDAHSVKDYSYCNILDSVPADESELIAMLKRGAYHLRRVPSIDN